MLKIKNYPKSMSERTDDQVYGPRLAFLVPADLVKTIRTILESHQILDKNVKIQQYHGKGSEGRCGLLRVLQSTLPFKDIQGESAYASQVLQACGLEQYMEHISLIKAPSKVAGGDGQRATRGNLLHEAFRRALQQLPEGLAVSLSWYSSVSL